MGMESMSLLGYGQDVSSHDLLGWTRLQSRLLVRPFRGHGVFVE